MTLVGMSLCGHHLSFPRHSVGKTGVAPGCAAAGKSTATASLGAILSAHFPTNWTPGGGNNRRILAETILRTRFRHRFTVIEVGTRAPGALKRAAWMIAPDIVVMLCVLNTHSNAFPTIEAMAAEKAQLLSRLGKRGLAILNVGDPGVLAMGANCRGPVRTFGTSEAFVTASERASSEFGLHIVAPAIQDDAHNRTRFAILAHPDRVLVAFRGGNQRRRQREGSGERQQGERVFHAGSPGVAGVAARARISSRR